MKKLNFRRFLTASLAACTMLGSLVFSTVGTAAAEDAREPQCQTSDLENIVITAFWPPNPNQLNLEEQIKLMADAGITEIFGAGNDCDTPEIQAQLLAEAEKHGMTMIVSDGSFGNTVLNLTEAEIMANVAKYAGNPVVTGFHLQDEPQNANIFIDAYKAIRKAAPHLDGHINFIHMTAVGGADGYNRKMGDWLSLTNGVCENPTWLMYDYYPFLYDETPFNHSLYLLQLDTVRKLGLKNDAPTGYYLQSAYDPNYPFNPANMRTPTAAENRYEVYSALAYGFKKLSYFTWVTGIVSLSGVVSDCYDFIAEVNHEVLALGLTLAKCDAVDVYMTQTQYEHTELLPEGYVISVAENQNADMILSRLVHKETGRNYIMLVNNNMTDEQSITFTVDPEITSLEAVSKTDGSLSAYEGENGTYTVTLAAGDGILLALPESYICPVDMERANASIQDENLAPRAKITASSSTGQDGWYVFNLTEGTGMPKKQNGDNMGWQSQNDETPSLIFDFGEPISFSEIKLYPSGASHDKQYGVHMPSDAVISVSLDGQSWTKAAEFADYQYDGGFKGTPQTVNLNGASGRYLRVEITEAKADENGTPLTQLGEIEIFGTPAADKSELNSLLKKYAYMNGDTASELYQSATAAAGDTASRQGYVDLLVKKMTPVVEELEANYVEPPAEEDTQAVTSETEDVTQILAPADTEEPADTDEDSGCGSAIGFGVAGLLTAMAAAVALKKKKD